MGHDFDTIAKFYRKIKNARPELISELERKITPKRIHNRRHLHEVKSMNKSFFEMNLENFEKKRKEMYEAVDKIINAHVDLMTLRNAGLDAEIKREEDTTERKESALMRMLDTFRETTMVGLDFIEYYEELKSKAHDLQMIDLSQHRSKSMYMVGEVICDNLEKIVGEVKEIHPNYVITENISSFQHKDVLVHTISPISPKKHGSHITMQTNSLYFARMDTTSTLPKNKGKHSFIMQNNAFLLCNPEGNNILKVDISGKLSEWLNVSPLMPRFIGHALSGNVLVSLIDDNFDSRAQKRQRKVQTLSPSGVVLRTYDHSVFLYLHYLNFCLLYIIIRWGCKFVVDGIQENREN